MNCPRPRCPAVQAEAERAATAAGGSDGGGVEDLLPLLIPSAMQRARPPISRFPVGAVGLGESGRVYAGMNLDFLGAPLSQAVHAQQFLIANAAAAGEPALRVIAVSHTPYRQFLQEIRGAAGIRILVTSDAADGCAAKWRTLASLLPRPFGPQTVVSPLRPSSFSHGPHRTAREKGEKRRKNRPFDRAAETLGRSPPSPPLALTAAAMSLSALSRALARSSRSRQGYLLGGHGVFRAPLPSPSQLPGGDSAGLWLVRRYLTSALGSRAAAANGAGKVRGWRSLLANSQSRRMFSDQSKKNFPKEKEVPKGDVGNKSESKRIFPIGRIWNGKTPVQWCRDEGAVVAVLGSAGSCTCPIRGNAVMEKRMLRLGKAVYQDLNGEAELDDQGVLCWSILRLYRSSPLLLVDHGMDVYKINQACTEFRMPIGSFRITDLVGFGVALATGMRYLENFRERVYKLMLIPLMIEDKRTGEASQKGFYRY
ncbi:cytidine deaminase 1-like [Hordeum vulgare]|nr:cytidine deaminase 1-like [Hordeum vulgare]